MDRLRKEIRELEWQLGKIVCNWCPIEECNEIGECEAFRILLELIIRGRITLEDVRSVLK